jgi:hypothetical protein
MWLRAQTAWRVGLYVVAYCFMVQITVMLKKPTIIRIKPVSLRNKPVVVRKWLGNDCLRRFIVNYLLGVGFLPPADGQTFRLLFIIFEQIANI